MTKPGAYDAMKARQMLVDDLARYREALKRIVDYDVEANHGPVDEWAEAEAFAAVSEIAEQALQRR